MENTPAKFDWIGWLASIPGIPADWGSAPIMATADSVVQMLAPTALPPLSDEPERIAA